MRMTQKEKWEAILNERLYEYPYANLEYASDLSAARDLLEKKGLAVRATIAALPMKDQIELALMALNAKDLGI